MTNTIIRNFTTFHAEKEFLIFRLDEPCVWFSFLAGSFIGKV